MIAGRRGYSTRHPDHFRRDLATLVALLERGVISPEVDVMPLSKAAEAHEALETGNVTSKLVLEV